VPVSIFGMEIDEVTDVEQTPVALKSKGILGLVCAHKELRFYFFSLLGKPFSRSEKWLPRV